MTGRGALELSHTWVLEEMLGREFLRPKDTRSHRQPQGTLLCSGCCGCECCVLFCAVCCVLCVVCCVCVCVLCSVFCDLCVVECWFQGVALMICGSGTAPSLDCPKFVAGYACEGEQSLFLEY